MLFILLLRVTDVTKMTSADGFMQFPGQMIKTEAPDTV